MKPTAVLINVARGALVDQEALYEALVQGRLGGAGLDVFESEPVDPNHPLLRLPNVVATPHVAGNTDEISRRRARFASENVERVAAGETPVSLIT
jgi:phosphoglycerate dehydrogenase-like enzyme